MNTILLAPGRKLSIDGISASIPAELIPVAGRPLIQRFVEYLSDSGRKEIAVVLQGDPERFSELLEAGERWGADIAYYRCGVDEEPTSFAVALMAKLHADTIIDPLNPDSLEAWGSATGGEPYPGALVFAAYLNTVMATLSGGIPAFVPSGRESEPGIRLSHHVRIHKTARLVPPVYIGEGVEIGAGATVGPFAALERGSVLGTGTTMRRSVLLPWTIVGENLSLEDVVVDGQTFFKPAEAAAYVAGDPFLSTSRKKR